VVIASARSLSEDVMCSTRRLNFFSLKSNPLTKPKDLEGKTLDAVVD